MKRSAQGSARTGAESLPGPDAGAEPGAGQGGDPAAAPGEETTAVPLPGRPAAPAHRTGPAPDHRPAPAAGRPTLPGRPQVPVQPTAADVDRAHASATGSGRRAPQDTTPRSAPAPARPVPGSAPPPAQGTPQGAAPAFPQGPAPGPARDTAQNAPRRSAAQDQPQGPAVRHLGQETAAHDPARRPTAHDPAQRNAAQDQTQRAAAPAPSAVRGEHTHSEPPAPAPRPVVQRASVRGQILDALRTALAAGSLTPGEVYSAPALGERFGVSATPVREAMQQLALEGAVEVVPNRGFRVVRRGARELAELAELRALIEVPVLLRLARTVPAERWAQLRPVAEETVRAAASGCPAAYGESDRAFHRAVLALSGNEQLVRLAEDLHRRAQWPLTTAPSLHPRTDLLADATEHTALLDALTTRDLDAVRFVLGEHFAATA